MEAAVGGGRSGVLAEQQAPEIPGHQAIGGGEPEAQRGGAEPIPGHQRVKKRDELGLREAGRLMETQKDAVMALVEEHRQAGRAVGEVLAGLGIARSTYYRWKQ